MFWWSSRHDVGEDRCKLVTSRVMTKFRLYIWRSLLALWTLCSVGSRCSGSGQIPVSMEIAVSSLDIVFCWKSWQWVRTNSRVHGDRCEFFGHCVLLEVMAVGQDKFTCPWRPL